MVCIPLGILMYLRITSGSFIEVLYGNALGIAVMTVCLIVYVMAVFISVKIVDIKV